MKDLEKVGFFFCFKEIASLKDSMDLKLNFLIREWKKSTDILFAIHPADGSLLTW